MVHNFSAGPAALPKSVIDATREAVLNLNGSGIGLIESSHRSAPFDSVITEAKERISKLLGLAEDQDLLFLHGGAQTQFFMIPMNLLRGGKATYLDTGRWSMLAAKEAAGFGDVDVAFSSSEDRYNRVPAQGEWAEIDPKSAYLHYTSNNTVAGSAFHYIPNTPKGVPLVCDASSDILSAPVDGSKFDILYAGAQKNMGPSGVTAVAIRKGLLERCDPDLPTMLRYQTHVEKDSMYNTPCTFGIFVMGECAKWIEECGGLEAVAANNRAQANRLYSAIDESSFYRGLVELGSRSIMNVTFATNNAEMDTLFWKTALDAGLSGLKGHRSVGGLRASIYNAQTDAAIDALIQFMNEFKRTKG